MQAEKSSGMDKYCPVKFILHLSSSESIPKRFKSATDSKLSHDFKEMFLKQENCDVVLNIKGHEFSAHRNILMARSPVFASTFRNDMKEKATNVIDIEDCDPSFFSEFLCFLYCGNVENLSNENVFSLFTIADKYCVPDLRSQCLEFLRFNLCVDNFCETATIAFHYSEKSLINVIAPFFEAHIKEIIVTAKWQTFVVENPEQSNKIMIKALVHDKK